MDLKDDNTIYHEAIEKLADDLREYFIKLGEIIKEVAEKLGEIIGEFNKSLDKSNKPKYKHVKSLIKPYKQPFIKVRYRARANL